MVLRTPPVLLAGTTNFHKLAEIRALLADLPVRLVGAAEIPAPVAIAEDGRTFEENARLKALAFAQEAAALPPVHRPGWVISDDSGLCVDALDGAPGIRSARYAGEGSSSEANNRKLLQALQGVEPRSRGGVFVCVVACAAVPQPGAAGAEREPRILILSRGECPGRIAEESRGRGGFGYDPLFLIPELGKTYAELSDEEKNRISHRARALLRFSELFRPILESVPLRTHG